MLSISLLYVKLRIHRSIIIDFWRGSVAHTICHAWAIHDYEIAETQYANMWLLEVTNVIM